MPLAEDAAGGLWAAAAARDFQLARARAHLLAARAQAQAAQAQAQAAQAQAQAQLHAELMGFAGRLARR